MDNENNKEESLNSDKNSSGTSFTVGEGLVVVNFLALGFFGLILGMCSGAFGLS